MQTILPPSGDLTQVPLPLLFAALCREQRTGALDLLDPASGKIRKRLYMRGGREFFVQGGAADESLARMLVRKKRITEEQFRQAQKERAETKKLTGEILLARGWITSLDLAQALESQTFEKLINCFVVFDGPYRWREVHPEVPGALFASFPPEKVVLAGLRLRDPNVRLRELHGLGVAQVARSDVFDQTMPNFALQPAEMRIVHQVRGTVPLDNLIGGPTGRDLAAPVLYALVVTGALHVPNGGSSLPVIDAPKNVAPAPRPAAPAEVAQPPSVAPAEVAPVPVAPAPPPVAPPPPEIPAPPVRPAGPVAVSEDDGSVSLSFGEAEELSKPSTKLSDAARHLYERSTMPAAHAPTASGGTLRGPKALDDVDMPPPKSAPTAPARSAPAAAGAAAAGRSASGAPARPATAKPGASAWANSGAAAGLEQEIETYLQRIQTDDYYALLDIPKDAQEPVIKKSYFKLAKKFHPDSSAVPAGPLKEKAEQVFGIISTAYNTLMDAALRKDYDFNIEHNVSQEDLEKANRMLEAEIEFQKAEIMLKQGNFRGAISIIQRAIDLNPEEPEYLMYKGWAVYKTAPKEKTSEGIALVEQAVGMGMKTSLDIANYYLGVMHRVAGDLDSAGKYLREATRINPNNEDAARELRGLGKRPEADAKKGGMFGRLKK